MISSAGSRFARFDQFVVDVARRRLTRDGEVVPLNSKTFDLLLALLESRGGLMTKDDLLARVWPGVAVEEGNLTVHVSALRRALGERRGEHRFVVTVPGRGYTFVADVMRDDESFSVAPVASAPAMATPRRTARRVAALAAAALVATFAVVYWRQHAASTHDSEYQRAIAFDQPPTDCGRECGVSMPFSRRQVVRFCCRGERSGESVGRARGWPPARADSSCRRYGLRRSRLLAARGSHLLHGRWSPL